MTRISDDELEDELLQVAGQAGRSTGKGQSKRKRVNDEEIESESEDVSLDDLDDQASPPADDATTSADRHTTKRRQVSTISKAQASRQKIGEFDENDLITDAADRARLAGMTELEREMELAERAEKRQQAMQREQLLQAAAAEQGTQANRRSGREVREEAARKSAMEELKEARLRKARGQPSRKVLEQEEEDEGEEEYMFDQEPLSDAEEGMLFDEDVGGGQREGRGRGRSAARHHRVDEEEEEEATYEEVKSIQVRRHKMEEWVEKPHFEMTMVGCVVRLAAGKKRDAEGSVVMDPTTGMPMSHYMIAQVLGVEEREAGMHKYLSGQGGASSGWKTPYPFGPSSQPTYKWLRVMRGQSERYWPLAQVSNGPMTEEEFASWHRLCETDRRGHQITRSEVEEVRKRLIAAENYVYSAEDVKRLLEEKRAKGKIVATNIAMERARLERERDAAAEARDESLALEIQARLDALVSAGLKSSTDSKQLSMAELNKRNAQRNFATAFSAQKASGQGQHDQSSGGGTGELDPFSRRATRSMIYWKTRQKGGEEPETEADQGNGDGNGNGEEDNEGQAEQLPQQVKKAGLDTIVDLSALDLSLLDMPPRIDGFARRLLGVRGAVESKASIALGDIPAGARTIGLGEYYSRQGYGHGHGGYGQQRYSHREVPRGYS